MTTPVHQQNYHGFQIVIKSLSLMPLKCMLKNGESGKFYVMCIKVCIHSKDNLVGEVNVK